MIKFDIMFKRTMGKDKKFFKGISVISFIKSRIGIALVCAVGIPVAGFLVLVFGFKIAQLFDYKTESVRSIIIQLLGKE